MISKCVTVQPRQTVCGRQSPDLGLDASKLLHMQHCIHVKKNIWVTCYCYRQYRNIEKTSLSHTHTNTTNISKHTNINFAYKVVDPLLHCLNTSPEITRPLTNTKERPSSLHTVRLQVLPLTNTNIGFSLSLYRSVSST